MAKYKSKVASNSGFTYQQTLYLGALEEAYTPKQAMMACACKKTAPSQWRSQTEGFRQAERSAKHEGLKKFHEIVMTHIKQEKDPKIAIRMMESQLRQELMGAQLDIKKQEKSLLAEDIRKRSAEADIAVAAAKLAQKAESDEDLDKLIAVAERYEKVAMEEGKDAADKMLEEEEAAAEAAEEAAEAAGKDAGE